MGGVDSETAAGWERIARLERQNDRLGRRLTVLFTGIAIGITVLIALRLASGRYGLMLVWEIIALLMTGTNILAQRSIRLMRYANRVIRMHAQGNHDLVMNLLTERPGRDYATPGGSAGGQSSSPPP